MAYPVKSASAILRIVAVVSLLLSLSPMSADASAHYKAADITTTQATGTIYYLATAADGGNDSNTGRSFASPWLTPNHSVHCGDVILAAASKAYLWSNFAENWGKVTCPAGNNVAWLKCVTFDACKITSTQSGLWVDQSYWGVQGWEVTITHNAYNACFNAAPNFSRPVEIHNIIFANDIANGCFLGGFTVSPHFKVPVSADYVAFVGNIAYNADQGSLACTSAFNIYEPVQADRLPGTHFYIAGNFAWGNFEPALCNGGAPSDGEGIILDTLNGSLTGLPLPYAAQIVVENNIVFLNGGRGIMEAGGGNSSAHVYIRHNTSYGNNGDGNQSQYYCAEIELGKKSYYTDIAFNLAASNRATGCGGITPVYALSVVEGDATDHVSNTLAYGINGNNNAVVYRSGSFAYGPNNKFGTDPGFAHPVNPGAPRCGSASSVPNCMATVIANFTPTAAGTSAYGYQIPNAKPIYDPLFPQWLCDVNLPSGLVTMGCLKESPAPASVRLHSSTKPQKVSGVGSLRSSVKQTGATLPGEDRRMKRS